jgi:phage terminase small subunit|tara:strand:- start:229 stop:750 length:522 start_codon:yes stop_codon:yes gene_type:complete
MPKEKFLTNRQKKFCELIMEGIYSNSECARRSGYSHGQANKTASLLLNGKDFPLVTQHLKELREVREKKYGVTLMGQLKRLSDLSRGAEEDGQFSASINAEKIRSALGGLSTDNRQNTIVHQLDKLSRDEIVARLSEIRKQYPSAFIEGDYKIVGSNKGEDKITSDLGDNTSS